MSKIKLLTFIINIIPYIIPHAKGFIAYDCSSTKMNITSFNTLNVNNCTPPILNKIEKNLYNKITTNNRIKTNTISSMLYYC